MRIRFGYCQPHRRRSLAIAGAALLGLASVSAEAEPSAPSSERPASQAWDAAGRPLPEPELLQPRLDPALSPYRACPIAGDLSLEGSAPAILPKLVNRWIAGFAEQQPTVSVRVPPPYQAPQVALSERLRLFVEGRIDFAFLSRDLAPADLAAFRARHGYEPRVIPVAGGSFRHFGFVDAVAVIVNARNPIERLTLAQADAVFSRSRLRGHNPVVGWADLGVTSSDRPIRVVGSSAWAGGESARATTIRRVILDRPGARSAWRDGADKADSEAAVPQVVAEDPWAIGFTGLGHLPPGVKALAIGTEAGDFVPPIYEDIARATYPLGRVVSLLVAVPPNAPLSPALAEFVRFLVSRDGQKIVLDQGVFLPLRSSQASAALALAGLGNCENEDDALIRARK